MQSMAEAIAGIVANLRVNDNAPELCPLCDGYGNILDEERRHVIRRCECVINRTKERYGNIFLRNTGRRYDRSALESLRASEPAMAYALGYLSEYIASEGKIRGLVLHGTPGSGKTAAAIWLGYQLTQIPRKALYINGWDFCDKITDFSRKSDGSDMADEYVEAAINAPVLVWDDLGTERVTEYVGVYLRQIINARYMDWPAKTTIIASNLDRAGMVKKYRDMAPTLSRLMGEDWLYWREVAGKDLRQEEV